MKDINYYREMYLKGTPKVEGQEVNGGRPKENIDPITNTDRGLWALLMVCALLITACCIFSVSHFAAAVFMVVGLVVMFVVEVKKGGRHGNSDTEK